jgi:hypothetical protein
MLPKLLEIGIWVPWSLNTVPHREAAADPSPLLSIHSVRSKAQRPLELESFPINHTITIYIADPISAK